MLILLLYIIDGILNIIAEYTGLLWLKYITKILLMPLLMLYLWKETRFVKSTKFIFLALLFSWFGDIFLMFPRNEYSETTKKLLFVFGLVSFLIAHINYIISFIKDIIPSYTKSVVKAKPYLLIPFAIYLYAMLNFLFPYLGSMKIPVVIYAICITTMLLTAFNRINMVRKDSFYFVFVGAIFFLISDTMLATKIFYKSLDWSSIIVMLTYIIAQGLIVFGSILNIKKK